MPNWPKGLKQAYDAQDAAFQAVKRFQAQLDASPSISESQALALSQLISALDLMQERIRIHRRVPLPGTARPKPAKAKPRRERVAPGARARPAPPVPDFEPAAEDEQSDHGPDLEAGEHGGGTPDV